MKKVFLISLLAIFVTAIGFTQVPPCSGCTNLGALSGERSPDVGEWNTYTIPTTCSGLYVNFAWDSGETRNITSTSFEHRVTSCDQAILTYSYVNFDHSCLTTSPYVVISPIVSDPGAPSGASSANTYQNKTYTTSSGYDDYTWSVTGGGYSITDNGSSANVTFVTTGTFTIKVKRENDCGWSDYSPGKSVTVTVN
jgi:hypothetical protein